MQPHMDAQNACGRMISAPALGVGRMDGFFAALRMTQFFLPSRETRLPLEGKVPRTAAANEVFWRRSYVLKVQGF